MIYTLIEGKTIHLAAGQKIVPAEQFATLLSLQEVKQQMQKDALQYREKIVQEMDEAYALAVKEGFDNGFHQWAGQIKILEERAALLQKEFEKILVPAAISAAKKIVGRELELKQDSIVDIVRQALKSLSQDKQFVIYVNGADLAYMEEAKPQLRQMLEMAQVIALRKSDDVEKGDCIIETEKGIIKVQARQQWEALEQALKNLVLPLGNHEK